MARPRKDSEERGAEARMIEAFWDQLSHMPYREVTAASIARQAECNRATFYYYFDSIEDLAEQAVDAAVPTGIANLARYRARSLPAVGALLKAEDSDEKQISLMD